MLSSLDVPSQLGGAASAVEAKAKLAVNASKVAKVARRILARKFMFKLYDDLQTKSDPCGSLYLFFENLSRLGFDDSRAELVAVDQHAALVGGGAQQTGDHLYRHADGGFVLAEVG